MFGVKIAALLAVTAAAHADLTPSDLAPVARLFRSGAFRDLAQETQRHLVRRQSGSDDDDDYLTSCPQLENVLVSVFGSRDGFVSFGNQCDAFFSGMSNLFQPTTNYDTFCQSTCTRPAIAALDAIGTQLRGPCPEFARQFGAFGMLMNSIVCTKTANNEYCASKFTALENADMNITDQPSLCNFTNSLGCCARQITSVMTNPVFTSVLSAGEVNNVTQHLGEIEAVFDACNASGACALPVFPPSSIAFNRPAMAKPVVNFNFAIDPSGLSDAAKNQIEQQVRDNTASAVGANSVQSVSVEPDGSGGIRVTVEFVDSVTPAQTEGLDRDAQISNMTVTYSDASGNTQTSQTTGASVSTTGGSDSASIAAPFFTLFAVLVAVLVM